MSREQWLKRIAMVKEKETPYLSGFSEEVRAAYLRYLENNCPPENEETAFRVTLDETPPSVYDMVERAEKKLKGELNDSIEREIREISSADKDTWAKACVIGGSEIDLPLILYPRLIKKFQRFIAYEDRVLSWHKLNLADEDYGGKDKIILSYADYEKAQKAHKEEVHHKWAWIASMQKAGRWDTDALEAEWDKDHPKNDATAWLASIGITPIKEA
jgi:hypothetical protein